MTNFQAQVFTAINLMGNVMCKHNINQAVRHKSRNHKLYSKQETYMMNIQSGMSCNSKKNKKYQQIIIQAVIVYIYDKNGILINHQGGLPLM